jgi:demethylmenaquinone methyltransferase/2-methoxy-6-polyprenyl-1,4-benzoquinol methylase
VRHRHLLSVAAFIVVGPRGQRDVGPAVLLVSTLRTRTANVAVEDVDPWKRSGSLSHRQPDVIPSRASRRSPELRQVLAPHLHRAGIRAHPFHAGNHGFESRWGYAQGAWKCRPLRPAGTSARRVESCDDAAGDDSVRWTGAMPSPRKRHAVQLFSGLPGRYDRVGAAMSFGQDARWRQALVDEIDPRPGMRILDVATGTGMVAFALAARGAEVVGLDQSEAMLAAARARLARTPALAPRIAFLPGEAEALPFADGEFDALSFTYLLRYVDDRAATMRELVRVVAPGGRIGMLEFGVPDHGALRGLWRAYTRVGLPLIGRAVSRPWYDVGRFLGPSIEQLHEAEPDLPALWREAGIAQVTLRNMSFGAGVVIAGVTDGGRDR